MDTAIVALVAIYVLVIAILDVIICVLVVALFVMVVVILVMMYLVGVICLLLIPEAAELVMEYNAQALLNYLNSIHYYNKNIYKSNQHNFQCSHYRCNN